MTVSAWPSHEDRRRWHDVWCGASPEERQLLLRFDAQALVRGLKIAEGFLRVRSAKQAQEVHEQRCDGDLEAKLAHVVQANDDARRRCGLDVFEYDEQLTFACFSLAFCRRADAFELLLARAAKTAERQLAVVSGMLRQTFASETGTWTTLAEHVYTLALLALETRSRICPVLRRELVQALALPRRTTLRSWPTKTHVALLRRRWDACTPQERALLTTVTGPAKWWLEALELLVVKQEAASGEALVQRRRAVGLQHFFGAAEPTEHLCFSPAFTASPKALDFLMHGAVPQATVKAALVQRVTLTPSRVVALATARATVVDAAPSWEGLATVVCTLVLHHVLERCLVGEALEAHINRVRAADVEQAQAKLAAKLKAKKARKKAGRTSLANEEMEVEPASSTRVEEADVSTTASGSSASSQASEASRWVPLSELPFAFVPWHVHNTFVAVDDTEGVRSRVRAASCPSR